MQKRCVSTILSLRKLAGPNSLRLGGSLEGHARATLGDVIHGRLQRSFCLERLKWARATRTCGIHPQKVAGITKASTASGRTRSASGDEASSAPQRFIFPVHSQLATRKARPMTPHVGMPNTCTFRPLLPPMRRYLKPTPTVELEILPGFARPMPVEILMSTTHGCRTH